MKLRLLLAMMLIATSVEIKNINAYDQIGYAVQDIGADIDKVCRELLELPINRDAAPGNDLIFSLAETLKVKMYSAVANLRAIGYASEADQMQRLLTKLEVAISTAKKRALGTKS